MQTPQSTPQASMTERFGAAAGIITAFLCCMPAYFNSWPWFYTSVLQYADHGSHELWKALWLGSIFLFIMMLVRFIIHLVVKVLATLLGMLAVKLTLKR